MVRLSSALLALTVSAGLAGCTYGGFGYGGVSVGVASGGYYDDDYYGWYDGFYYPGSGYYIYDRGGNRHRWDDHHRRHWEGRGQGRDGREHWAGFDRDGDRDGRRERDWRVAVAPAGAAAPRWLLPMLRLAPRQVVPTAPGATARAMRRAMRAARDGRPIVPTPARAAARG